MQIVQISDTHISIDAPQRLQDLKNCVRAINALHDKPDLVIHTGDVSHNGLIEEYQVAKQELDKLNAPYFVIPGNRDKRPEMLAEFADERYRLPAEGWVQYVVDEKSVRLLMVDTLNEQGNKGQLCAQRLKHLESMILADTNKPTALFLHHPPYEATGIPDPHQYSDWQDVEKLTELLSQFTHISGVYCGHVHRFIDGTIAGIEASAITCLAGDLRKGLVTDEERKEPVFKILKLGDGSV